MGMSFQAGQKVFIDTAPLIYWFEDHPVYVKKMAGFFDEITKKHIPLITSMITYIEVLTQPARLGADDLADKYRDYFLNSEQLNIYPLDMLVADAAVNLRATYALRTPDAIQLATAQVCGCNCILSNDRKWRRTKSLRILLVDEL